MPSQFWAPFVGGFYRVRQPIAAADQAINIYEETRQAKGSPKDRWILGTPGLVLEATLPTMPNRGWFSQDGQTWTVSGDTLYERTAPGTYVANTSVIFPDDGFPVTFASNGLAGDQLAISGGGVLGVLNLITNALVAVALPFPDPVMVTFQDGYGLINQKDTPTVWFSALEDFTSVDPLDFFTRSGTSDNVVGLAITRDRLFVLGSKTTTLYYDSGDADTPWLPYPGTTTQVGVAGNAWPTISVYNDVVRWLAASPRGGARMVQSRSDMSVQTISTPPLDDIFKDASTLANAECLTYEQSGHAFVLITLPSGAESVQTYGYDVLESQLQEAPVWHARAGWNTQSGLYTRWRARGSTVVDNTVLVGDYSTGAVYTLELDAYDDNETILRRERRAPYVSTANQWAFIDQFELAAQAGVGISSGQGSDPVVELQISRDGAKTWISAGFKSIGATGEYLTRPIWRQLGRSRADRLVFRVIQTDPVACCWVGAWPTLTAGTGQL